MLIGIPLTWLARETLVVSEPTRAASASPSERVQRIAPEPTATHDTALATKPGDLVEQQRVEPVTAEPALLPPPPLRAHSAPAHSEQHTRQSTPREPSRGVRRLQFPLALRYINPFYVGAAPTALERLDEEAVSLPASPSMESARGARAGGTQLVAGLWIAENAEWLEGLEPARPTTREVPGGRQCLELNMNQRRLLRWRSRGTSAREGFELVAGRSYRLVLSRVSVSGPVQLEAIAGVGSSEADREPALVAHLPTSPTPATLGLTFVARRDDADAPVFLFIDAGGPPGLSELCLGRARIEPVEAMPGPRN